MVMNKFPKCSIKVVPLYQKIAVEIPAINSNYFVENPTKKAHFSYQSGVQVIRSNMYEPVIDRCPINCANQTKPTDLVPPEKPPRKLKMKRHISQEVVPSTINCDNNRMRKTPPASPPPTTTTVSPGDVCVDIDNINLETNNFNNNQKPNINNNQQHHNNNNNNKLINKSVQTTHLVPYRLRFWPRTTCDKKCDPNETNCCTTIRITCICRIISQWLLSQIGLTIVVLIWALLGALAFYHTEGPRELEQSNQLIKLQNDLSIQLATILRQTDEYKDEWYNTVNKYMKKHESLLLEAVSAGYGEGGNGSIWTYPGCILFAVSLLTTLGFGAPVPRTSLGRGSAILFAAIGIPLHFLLILNMGNLGAVKLQQLAYRNCNSLSEIPIIPQPKWLKFFPIIAIFFYYIIGVTIFGFIRQHNIIDSLMFPLNFTAAGGVAQQLGYIRIIYAIYLEFAVTLAALLLSLIQASATRGIVDIGLKLGLLTNT